MTLTSKEQPSPCFGRERFIDEFWRTLDGSPPFIPGKSIYINDLRRIGKTVILDELERNPKNGYIVIKWDVEGCASAAHFVGQICKDASRYLPKGSQTGNWLKEKFASLGGIEIGGIITLPKGNSTPWQKTLEVTIRELHDYLEEEQAKLVFLWDEIPALLENIINGGGGEKEALETGLREANQLLNTLRSLRQNYPLIRMVFTGSIGIHHVLAKLRRGGYSEEPLNDMEPMWPGPLASDDGTAFAGILLKSRGMTGKENVNRLAFELSSCVGHIPFYIVNLVNAIPLDLTAEEITLDVVRNKFEDALLENKWGFGHYYDRLQNDYSQDTGWVLRILDILAVQTNPLSREELTEKLSQTRSPLEDSHLLELLTLLRADHYLSCAKEGKARGSYFFKYELIRRWWCEYRQLRMPKNTSTTKPDPK